MKVMIFGGTSEGREQVQAHLARGDEVVACVTGDFARRLLPPGARVPVGILDEDGMAAAIAREAPDMVVDATHPFAVRAGENIRRAALRSGVTLRRVQRQDSARCAWAGDVEWVTGLEEAAEALKIPLGTYF